MVWLKVDRIERFEWSDRMELTIIHSAIIQPVICNQSLINQTAQSNQSNGDVEFSRYCNTLIRTFNSVRIRIIYFRKPKKVYSDYRQDTESVKLEDTCTLSNSTVVCIAYWKPFSFPFNLNDSREVAIRQHVFFFFFFFFLCCDSSAKYHLLEYVPFRLNVWWTRRAIQTLHKENMIRRGDWMTE